MKLFESDSNLGDIGSNEIWGNFCFILGAWNIAGGATLSWLIPLLSAFILIYPVLSLLLSSANFSFSLSYVEFLNIIYIIILKLVEIIQF